MIIEGRRPEIPFPFPMRGYAAVRLNGYTGHPLTRTLLPFLDITIRRQLGLKTRRRQERKEVANVFFDLVRIVLCGLCVFAVPKSFTRVSVSKRREELVVGLSSGEPVLGRKAYSRKAV